MTPLQSRTLELRRQGKSQDEIAAAIPTSVSTVARCLKYLRSIGVDLPVRLNPESEWTAERVEQLRKLWTVDGHNAAQIAETLGGGITRSAVLGKLNRLGLSGEDKPLKPRQPKPRKPRARKLKPVIVKDHTPQREEAKMVPVLECELKVRFIDHDSARQCHYPLGETDGINTLFCGHEAMEGSSYCPSHRQRCYTPYKPKEGASVVPFMRDRRAA